MKKRKIAFSLVETLIMLTVLAVVVASTTPIISRKLINIGDPGETYSSSKGQIEISSKSIITFVKDVSEYKDKIGGDSKNTYHEDPANSSSMTKATPIIVYEKKDEKFYSKLTGQKPEKGAGDSSTLYEEIQGATPDKIVNGKVVTAKKKVNNKVQTYVIGNKYLLEDASKKYTKPNGEALNRNQNRIIESRLTSKFNKKCPQTNNNLWQFKAQDEKSLSGDEAFDKTIDDLIKGDLIIYERKDDYEYKDLTGSMPASNGNYKSTLYEEIANGSNVKVVPIKDKSGAIVRAEITVNGIKKKIEPSTRYLFENPKVTYNIGKLKIVNGMTTFVPDESGRGDVVKIDRDKNRIIEGNYTSKYHKKNPSTNNNLWHIEANSGKFNGESIVIPWETIISGSNVVVDKPVKKDINGKFVVDFIPPKGTQNIVVHAVGGGGAGGAPCKKSLDAYADPQSADNAEINTMVKQLATKVKDVARDKGVNLDNVPDGTIVKVVYDITISEKNMPSEFINNDNAFILLNKANGTITVKTDIRNGLIFPHELLEYTKKVGAQTQKPEVHPMPEWFNWDDIKNSHFKAGAVACGGAGGHAGKFVWITNKRTDAFDCFRAKYGMYGQECDKVNSCPYQEEISCPRPPKGKGSGGKTHTPSRVNPHEVNSMFAGGICTKTVYKEECGRKVCTCANTDYYHCPHIAIDIPCGGNQNVKCPLRIRNNKEYTHTYTGGAGGAAPKCVWISKDISQKPVKVDSYCEFSPVNGAGGGTIVSRGAAGDHVNAAGVDGHHGATCVATVDGVNAYSYGGMGGLACRQAQWDANDSDRAPLPPLPNGTPLPQGYEEFSSVNYILAGFWMCEALPVKSCGRSGKSGSTGFDPMPSNMYRGEGKPNPFDIGGGSYGIGSDSREYNYIYIWTIPFGTNHLGYGESGQQGEYVTTKVSKVEGTIFITIGQGGTWKDDDWKDGSKGPDGSDTIIEMGNDKDSASNVIVAPGGSGGKGCLNTDCYQICYTKDRNRLCADDTPECCPPLPKTTDDVVDTHVKQSGFDDIKSFTGKSKIIGIGLGQGAQGIGTSENLNELYGDRKALNATASSEFDDKIPERTIYKQGQPEKANPPASFSKNDYKNKLKKPANVNYHGGGGAAILSW